MAAHLSSAWPARRSGAKNAVRRRAQRGVEYAFTLNWSAKLAYHYTPAVWFDASHINKVLVGLNYRFGGF
jgi:opacity protein-like surface antigen